jgi:hypothetical protein
VHGKQTPARSRDALAAIIASVVVSFDERGHVSVTSCRHSTQKYFHVAIHCVTWYSCKSCA